MVSSVTIKKINREIKKIPKKNSKSNKNTSVMENVADNKYLQMCKEKRGRNREVLSKVVEDIKKKVASPRRTPKRNESKNKKSSPKNIANKKPSAKKRVSSPKTIKKPRKFLRLKRMR